MHWDACFLPDNYIRKMKQDLAEMEELVESKTKLLPVHDDRPAFEFDQSPPEDD